MKYKILFAPFPFGDINAKKFRPVLCLSEPLGRYEELILAYITSNTFQNVLESDFLIEETDSGFQKTGLKVSSSIKLHKLFTLPKNMILGQLGELSVLQIKKIEEKIHYLFF